MAVGCCPGFLAQHHPGLGEGQWRRGFQCWVSGTPVREASRDLAVLPSLRSSDLCHGPRKNRGCVFPLGARLGRARGRGNGVRMWKEGGNGHLQEPGAPACKS